MMLYLMIAGVTALVTLLFTTDNYQLLLLPFLPLAQLDWGMVPNLFQCAQGATRMLRGKKDSDLPSCYPDVAVNFQILGLFNARVECQNRVAVELAKRVRAGNDQNALADPLAPKSGEPKSEQNLAPTDRAGDATEKTPSVAAEQHLPKTSPETRRLRAATSLAETCRSARLKNVSNGDARPPQWSCKGLRRATGGPLSKECSASERRSGKAAATVPRWRMPSKRQPFRDNSSAA